MTATERNGSTALTEAIRAEALRLGFDAVGITPVQPSEHAQFYESWLAAGRHGEMTYLARAAAVERRLYPHTAMPALRSAVVVALNYYVADGPTDAAHGIIAKYARGRDYHKVIRKKLLELLAFIEHEIGRELPAARAYVDTGPVLERELARRAGLGWFGRNTMLIHPKRGSYFFLGSLLVELELDADAPFASDHCGTCTSCVTACPTGALLGRDTSGAPVIDATRCISYQTIENRGAIPRELRPLIGNRIFGCDICQAVCPWNAGKFVQITREVDFDPKRRERERESKRKRDRAGTGTGTGTGVELPRTISPSLIALMRMTHEEWDEWTRGSAMRRAGYAGLKRNVAVALGNWGAEETVPVLVKALSDSEALVRGHAAWALGEIPAVSALAALADRMDVEDDPWVRGELELALARSSDRSSSRGRSGAERSVT
ncbi:MAG TPA: tRNA epoxyqueuosine(34) reductase QueG [Longimicrobiales bacterium]|nr:tRNA epoxyqueuosine(34) reductase QueG [Longimicrobiales bacterium]